jgi:hypothetical protein
MTRAGLPHSDTPGSTFAYNSPRIFAVCRVLHRHSVPRHPPYALNFFYILFFTLSHFYSLLKDHTQKFCLVPSVDLVEDTGLEPVTSALQRRRSTS